MIQIVKSANNSTTVALGASAAFVGSWDVLTSFQEVDINLAGAPAVAPGTLYFEFSPDGVNADLSVPIVVAGPSIVPLPLRTILPFFRVRYVNGATPLTQLRLTVTLHREASGRITRLASQALDPNEPLEVNRIARSVLPDGAATEATLATRAAATDVQAVTTALAVSQPRTVTGTVAVSSLPSVTVASAPGLTDTQLRAAAVPVSGTVSTGGLTNTELRASAVPISAASLPLPSGAATNAAIVAALEVAQPRVVSGTVAVSNHPANLTDAQLRASAVPVSAAALPLPAGASTETTLALIKAKTDNLDVALSTRAVTGLTDAQLRAVAVPVSGPLTDAQLRATAVPTTVGDEIVVTRYDLASDTTNYIGKAPLGTSTATASWRIKRLQFVAGNLETKMWSSATAIWNNRAAESYT